MVKKRYAIVPAATPFDKDLRLDESALRRQLRRLREAGTAVNLGGPGTGAAFTMTPHERDRVFEIGVEELKGIVPVRAMGREPRTPGEMVEFVRRAEQLNVDAVQVYSLDIGHGAKPTVTEMERYYSAAIEATALPVYLSCHLRSAGYVLPFDLLDLLLARHPNIVGINIAGQDVKYLAELIKQFGDRMEVHCAGVANSVNVLALGGNGFMGVEGNLAPRLFTQLIADFEARDTSALRDSFAKVIGLLGIVERFGGSTGRGLKPLMNALGLPGGNLRPPLVEITPVQLEEFMQGVRALDIPELRSLSSAG